MATAGYSNIPLIQKLGIKPGMKVLLLHAPGNYAQLLGVDITDQLVKAGSVPDLIHLFAADNTTFEKGLQKILALGKKNTGIIAWVSWYKKSAGMATDLTENIIRDAALQNGLVDVKVCAVSDVWSGLKLVVPLTKR